MKRTVFVTMLAAALTAALVLGAPVQAAKAVTGHYVEARSCDVYTGPCFANGEVGLTGAEAILSWSVESGDWNGTRLDGLTVIAVIAASNTLGNPYQTALPAKSVVIVDANASAAQKAALVEMAKSLGGNIVAEVVDVKAAAIVANVGVCTENGCARVEAKGLVEISTRCLQDGDHKCGGNEYTFYPPLTAIQNATPAYTNVSSYAGDGLGITWINADRRSAFVGTFAI